MRVSKIVREYIEKTLEEKQSEVEKNDPVIQEWVKVKKTKEEVEEQLKKEFIEKLNKAYSELGFVDGNTNVTITGRNYYCHPAFIASKNRIQELAHKRVEKINDIFLELELGGATKEGLEKMLKEVNFS